MIGVRAGVHSPVLNYVRMRAGLSLAGLERIGAQQALARVQRKLRIPNEQELVHLLHRDNQLFDALIAELTVGETYFFRDRAQLDAIRRIVLPALRRIRSPNHVLRMWSAGCSSGEEPYSLAILAEQEGLLRNCSILASDISEPALERARKARYGRWSFRSTDADVIDRYFSTRGHVRQVVPRIRECVRFTQLNLALSEYPSGQNGTGEMDLILCRNVLIYFDPNTIVDTAHRLYSSLAPGGWLITGPSDPPLWHLAALTPVIVPGAVIYKREDRVVPFPVSSGRAKAAHPTQQPISDIPQRRRAPASALSPPLADPARVPFGRENAEPEISAGIQLSEEELCGTILDAILEQGAIAADALLVNIIEQNPALARLRYLRAILLMSMNLDDAAIVELRRLLYLDRSLAVAHLTMGLLLQKTGNLNRARQSFSNAYRIAVAKPSTEELDLGEGLTAEALAALARDRMSELAHNTVRA